MADSEGVTYLVLFSSAGEGGPRDLRRGDRALWWAWEGVGGRRDVRVFRRKMYLLGDVGCLCRGWGGGCTRGLSWLGT